MPPHLITITCARFVSVCVEWSARQKAMKTHGVKQKQEKEVEVEAKECKEKERERERESEKRKEILRAI